MSTRHPLFLPFSLGSLALKNRIAMAPMTRSRADANGVVGDITATYYKQRSTAGLIITEGTFCTPMGKGYVRIPGLATDEQTAAWKKVTDAVHENKGVIFVQLMECGRIAHSSLLPNNAQPIAPSAIKPVKTTHYSDIKGGFLPLEMPRALEEKEIAQVIEGYGQAAERAVKAGFDGVELHAASGYLPHQFIASSSNKRTDGYGGSAKNRIRFVLEVLQRLSAVRGSQRVGIKISPCMNFNEVIETPEEAKETYSLLVSELNKLNLAYLHIMRTSFDSMSILAPLYKGNLIAGAGFDVNQAKKLIDDKQASMIAFGASFLANPDLPRRLENGIPLNAAQQQYFYTPGPKGYIDYPDAAL